MPPYLTMTLWSRKTQHTIRLSANLVSSSLRKDSLSKLRSIWSNAFSSSRSMSLGLSLWVTCSLKPDIPKLQPNTISKLWSITLKKFKLLLGLVTHSMIWVNQRKLLSIISKPLKSILILLTSTTTLETLSILLKKQIKRLSTIRKPLRRIQTNQRASTIWVMLSVWRQILREPFTTIKRP